MQHPWTCENCVFAGPIDHPALQGQRATAHLCTNSESSFYRMFCNNVVTPCSVKEQLKPKTNDENKHNREAEDFSSSEE